MKNFDELDIYAKSLNNISSQSKYLLSAFNNSVNLVEGSGSAKLLSTLTHLVLGNSFNKSVDYLSPELEYLEFGYLFNQEVDNLPHKLKYLTFGYSFNQCVDNLPCSLIEINFSFAFNMAVDNLPCLLKSLTFCKEYEYTKDYVYIFPPGIAQSNIIKPFAFSQNLETLPNSLEYLRLNPNYKEKINYINTNLKTIRCSENYPFQEELTILITKNI